MSTQEDHFQFPPGAKIGIPGQHFPRGWPLQISDHNPEQDNSQLARIVITNNTEQLWFMIRFFSKTQNWEILIRRGHDPETQSLKLLGAHPKDGSPYHFNVNGDIILNAADIYKAPRDSRGSPILSERYVALVGCKWNVQKGQTGKVAVKAADNFPYSTTMTWRCDER